MDVYMIFGRVGDHSGDHFEIKIASKNKSKKQSYFGSILDGFWLTKWDHFGSILVLKIKQKSRQEKGRNSSMRATQLLQEPGRLGPLKPSLQGSRGQVKPYEHSTCAKARWRINFGWSSFGTSAMSFKVFCTPVELQLGFRPVWIRRVGYSGCNLDPPTTYLRSPSPPSVPRLARPRAPAAWCARTIVLSWSNSGV